MCSGQDQVPFDDSESEDDAVSDALAAVALCAAVKKKNKKKQKWSKNWLQEREHSGSYQQLFKELQAEDPKDVQNYIRMPLNVFHMILGKISPIISKDNTVMRDSISPGARLEATLRFGIPHISSLYIFI